MIYSQYLQKFMHKQLDLTCLDSVMMKEPAALACIPPHNLTRRIGTTFQRSVLELISAHDGLL